MKNFVRAVALFVVSGILLGAVAGDQGVVAAQSEGAPMTKEQEIRRLEQERVELVKTIRMSNERAMQDRRKAIAADPELAALQARMADLERQLKSTRDELQAKMAAAGIKVDGAPQTSLDGMARLREIEARLRELSQQPEQEKPAKPLAQAAGAVDGGVATQE